MSLSVETLAVARKYTDDSLAGAGAVAGVPCKIQSITAITGGNRVTFLWTDNNGDDHTSAMDVMNGVDGEDGKGIQSVTVNAQDHLIITYTDGTTVDAGQIEIHSSVDSVNGQTGAVVLDAEDVGALPDNTPIPSKTSDLTNDSGFATTSDVSTALADYTTTADLTTLLAGKQDTLTFDNVPTENSNNPVKSGGVYAANQTLTSAFVNNVNENGCKNILFSATLNDLVKCNTNGTWHNNQYTVNDITFEFDFDGSVLRKIYANGTASAATSLIFSDRRKTADIGKEYYNILSQNNYSVKETPSGVNFAVDLYNDTTWLRGWNNTNGKIQIALDYSGANVAEPYVFISSGTTLNNVAIYPMICLATDYALDSSYVPPSKTNQQLTQDTTGLLDNLEVNGAVNMLPNSFADAVSKGVSLTNNANGTLNVSGTNDGTGNGYFNSSNFKVPDSGLYKITGLPETVAGSSIIDLYLFNVTDNQNVSAYATYIQDYIYNLDSSKTYRAVIAVYKGRTVPSRTIIKPMLSLASLNLHYGDYVPYAMTNRELTEKIDIVGNLFTTTTKVVDNITHGIATTVATLENLPIGTYVVSGQFNSDSAMSGGGLVQFASSGVIQNGATCSTIINQGFKANAGLTGIFNVTNATNQINLQIYTATADLTVSSARLAAIRIA